MPTEPNRFVDITDTLETKIAAFIYYDSQVTDPAQVRENMTHSAASVDANGRVCYREAFHVMIIG